LKTSWNVVPGASRHSTTLWSASPNSQERLYDIQADQYKRTQEQFRQTDARIERLVRAIASSA
jgi:hypothetical protein